MKMAKPGLCCDSCFASIARRSPRAARLWLDLCEIQLTAQIFAIVMPDSLELQLLEHFGFVTTTETSHFIIIKVHGKRIDSLGEFFCGGNCDE